MSKLILPGLFAAVLMLPVMAASPRPANASATGEHLDIETALKSCAVQVKAETPGHPDRAAFDACMSAKGFEKPAGPPPGERHGPKVPPKGKKPMHVPSRPANASAAGGHAEIEVALKACSEQVKADASGHPNFAEFDACMRAKGFEKPAGPPAGERRGPKPPLPAEGAGEPHEPPQP